MERLIDRVFLARGVERLKLTPREYQDKVAELVVGAKEIRAALSAEELHVWELPRAFTPDSWRSVIQMMRESVRLSGNKGIQISRPPKGSTPEIAKGWVGTTIPFSETPVPPMVFVTPELEEGGMTSSDNRCYVVSSLVAVSVLEKHNPQAADVFRENMPNWAEKKQVLIFDSDCCDVVDTA